MLDLLAQSWAGKMGATEDHLAGVSELREDAGGQAAGEACAIRLHIQRLHYAIVYHHGEPAGKGRSCRGRASLRTPRANGEDFHFTSSAGGSQRATPKNHPVINLSPRRQAEMGVKSPQTGQKLLPT